MPTRSFSFPPRYEPVAPLGRGGGGEVWSVRDRTTGDLLALKVLSEDAREEELVALVREAVALSGLEGLGVPRVRSFGRLPGSGRAYLVREIVEGENLGDCISTPAGAQKALLSVVEAAEAVTVLHRAGLLHGDIKPANLIVGPRGTTLVDLGLAAVYREGGARALGLTPKYAAPELLEGGALTVRAEVFALGATLREVADAASSLLSADAKRALSAVVERATSASPGERFPSADELAAALSRVLSSAGLNPRSSGALPGPEKPRAWPIVGLDGPAHDLTSLIENLPEGGGVVLTGPRLSGRSTLMRRVAWTLGARGRRVAHIESRLVADPRLALSIELGEGETDLVALVDDIDVLDPAALERLSTFRDHGGRLVVIATPLGTGDADPASQLSGSTMKVFAIPPLEERLATDLVLRAIPSLSPALVAHVAALAEQWPGRLRAIVELIAEAPVVAPEDVDRLVSPGLFSGAVASLAMDLRALRSALDRGHFEEAAELLAPFETERSLALATARARLYTNRGEARRALAALAELEVEALSTTGIEPAEWLLHSARAHLRAGDYAASERQALDMRERLGGAASSPEGLSLVAEAVSVVGLAQSFSSRHEEARASLSEAVALAREVGEPRLLSVTLGSLAFALQRNDALDEAEKAYEEALGAAEQAGDAGSVATTRLNLATIAMARGDLASTLAHLEASVDMGRRSGRVTTQQHALLNLANLDLYIGRIAKAQAAIDALASVRDDLPRTLGAQLIALEAEAAGKASDHVRAYALCQRCADAYVALGRTVDAAEARLEGMLFALAAPSPDLPGLGRELTDVTQSLEGTSAHRALMEVVGGRIAQRAGALDDAKAAFNRAIQAAESANLRDWQWRALQLRAEVALDTGQTLAARKDREAALAILEDIASKLPRDLREVYWNDPQRRSLRPASSLPQTLHDRPAVVLQAPTQDRFARLLEINREIAGTYDLKRLLERVTDHAIALVSAERGLVILKSSRPEAAAALSIHASRGEAFDDPHARFSQSIADRVIASGEAVVTTSARDDARMADYVSVHQLMLQSVACVPIRSRSSGVIGALYLETRLRPASRFTEELGLLAALADQVAIAIETARLVSENEARTEELARTNLELAGAREKLEELLDHRTAQLSATRRDLRSARAVLKSHFGYEGLVGTSEAMRRVYALVDRIKDTDVPVLIVGESGTGKEIIARAIHNAGPRAKKTFVGINCAAIPEHLLESELFGHVRGAFTGADRDRRGLFREAAEGTILLDEVGEMPHKMQAGLLRVLQEKLVRPVGGAREEPVDTRVIAATHRDLAAMVEAGTFREDLFYRLNVILVRVPPLRERLDDIPVLIDHFLGIFAARYARERRSVSRTALKLLMSYRWPGNVRQLENVLLNAWVLSDAPELEPEDFDALDAPQRSLAKPTTGGPPANRPTPSSAPTSLDGHRNEERDRITAALSSANWNRVKAAELIGMPRRTFYRRLKEYGIQ